MPERTIEASNEPELTAPTSARARSMGPAGTLITEHPGVSAAVVVFLLSVLLILAAGTRPGFDPYGWIVWGRQTLHWNLDTNGAPSWKPLPYLLTVPYALAGHYALWLWILTAVSVSLGGVVFAARLAYRLTNAPPERRYAAYAAGAVAGLGLLGIRDYSHFILSAQSDTMIVTLCLAAIDAHLSGRPRIAFVLGVLASLGRPETWPFLGLYALWAARAIPSMRPLIAGGLAVIPLLWFGIPALTAKSATSASDLALNSPRALHGNKILGVIDRFFDLHEWPVQVVALCAVGFAAIRREWVTLVIAGGALAWVVVEIAFALHGFPAVPRYLFEPTAVVTVLTGVAVGKLLAAPARVASPPGWVALAAIAVLGVGLAPAALSRIRVERKDLTHERARTRQIGRLHALVVRLGGSKRILQCGPPETTVAWESILAWETNVNVGVTYISPGTLHGRNALVLFQPHRVGWIVRPLHSHDARTCRRLARRTATS